MNHDRVSELYRGDLSNDESQRICRDRIHWLVSESRGRVLDVGCSQGITTILLGRAGYEVVGVDVEEPSIEFARAELAKESPAVQRRVRLLLADAHGDVFGGETFDTIVLGEILEHLADPRTLWLRVAKLLRPGGRLVGTTPFGLHPHHDHKVTFYFRSFLETIAGVGVLMHLDVRDDYIRFIVSPSATSPVADTSAETLLAMSERAFLDIQLESEQDRTRRKQANERLLAQVRDAQAKCRDLDATRAKLTESQAEVARVRQELEVLRGRTRQLEQQAVPPSGASASLRGASALLGSIQRELNGGGLFTAPVASLRKTYARVRRALREPNGSSH